MRIFTAKVFDDWIAGTGKYWYTSSSDNQRLGLADSLTLHAITTNVGGGNLSCTLEHSGDGRHWNAVFIMSPGVMTEGFSYFGESPVGQVKLGLVRVKISLTGTSPKCRLKLFVTGRSHEVVKTAMPRITPGRPSRSHDA